MAEGVTLKSLPAALFTGPIWLTRCLAMSVSKVLKCCITMTEGVWLCPLCLSSSLSAMSCRLAELECCVIMLVWACQVFSCLFHYITITETGVQDRGCLSYLANLWWLKCHPHPASEIVCDRASSHPHSGTLKRRRGMRSHVLWYGHILFSCLMPYKSSIISVPLTTFTTHNKLNLFGFHGANILIWYSWKWAVLLISWEEKNYSAAKDYSILMQNTLNYTHILLLRRPRHYQRRLCFWGFHGYYRPVMSKRYRWNSFSVNSSCFIITCILLGSQEHGFNRHGLERWREGLYWYGSEPPLSFKRSSGKHGGKWNWPMIRDLLQWQSALCPIWSSIRKCIYMGPSLCLSPPSPQPHSLDVNGHEWSFSPRFNELRGSYYDKKWHT